MPLWVPVAIREVVKLFISLLRNRRDKREAQAIGRDAVAWAQALADGDEQKAKRIHVAAFTRAKYRAIDRIAGD